MRCIIVDDEEGAHLVLEHYFRETRHLELCKAFYNAMDAMDYLYQNKVDLVFLDINMPGLSGLDMLEAMSNPPLVVLTTAYSEFALQGYKYEVVDYLVKPFEFSNFLAAVDKVWNRKRPILHHDYTTATVPVVSDYLYLKVESDVIKVKFAEISHIQSWGNYIRVYTDKGMFLSAVTTTEIEGKLAPEQFMRIHKSYIIALNRIYKVTGSAIILDDGTEIPIGNTFRRKVLDYFKM
ncbi:LytTR family DNA-binding domain-containing protein [Chitinophaga sp.]|uniref:LytR/AlgR family response regulator transcription factor n=1 Tax=Chitinophaga sp. TaxID=1869181 RepID=UPI0031D53973